MTPTVGLLLLSTAFTISGTAAMENKGLETNDISNYYMGNSINIIFDIFLRRYSEMLIKMGGTKVQIPGFQERFSTKVMGLNIDGAAIVGDGWCSNISTVHRTGNAEMTRVDSDVILTAHLGLAELEMDYNDYDLSFLGVHQKGKIHVNIGENSVWVKLQAQLVPKCVITLTNMKIEKLDDINVDISHLGIFEEMTDEITSWVANEVTKWYRTYMEHTVFPEMAKIVKDADLCHYLPIANF